MRRRPPPVDFSGEEPPQELLRFRPSQPAPVGPHGPEPWRRFWEPNEFANFLRARQAWRQAHREPLLGLRARERCVMRELVAAGQLPPALVEAECDAPAKSGDNGWFHRGRYVADPREWLAAEVAGELRTR